MASLLAPRSSSLLFAVLLSAPACQSGANPPSAVSPPSKGPASDKKPKPEATPKPEPKPKPEATPKPEGTPESLVPSDPIATALERLPESISSRYVLSISEDRGELTIDPRPQPRRRAARSGGFSVKDSENGGKIISLHGGPFRNGGWVQASFRERAPAGRIDELKKAGYDVDKRRDLLVVDGERDSKRTLFAFSADMNKPGIVGVCSEVTIVDFGPGATPPRPIAVRKPVVYLYPETTTRVSVGLTVDGAITAAYPALREGSWTVTAEPSGALVDEATGRRHRYLFWEASSAGFELDRDQAHCVPGGEAAAFLEGACARFDLTADECGDMVTYWLPELSRNPYNVIQFVDAQTYGRYARLSVTPSPDTVIRPFMIFERSDVPVEVGAPELPQHRRGGFTVVEWGGADLDSSGSEGIIVH